MNENIGSHITYLTIRKLQPNDYHYIAIKLIKHHIVSKYIKEKICWFHMLILILIAMLYALLHCLQMLQPTIMLMAYDLCYISTNFPKSK